MLDFQKLMLQIKTIGHEHLTTRSSVPESLLNAQNAYEDACANAKTFAEKLKKNELFTHWPLAMPMEPFDGSTSVTQPETPFTVVAADGSQIMPSHHEVYNCYLLNVGRTILSYGVSLPPVLDSLPSLYYRQEDMYPLVDKRRIHIDELYVSLERSLLELQTVEELGMEAYERKLPVIAFVDGSLIPWSLDKMPENYQIGYMAQFNRVLQNLRAAEIPLIGYVSHSRSSDIINALRVWKCPYTTSHCKELCGHLNEDDFPCSTVWPLTDRELMSGNLAVGTRSPLMLSGVSIARALPPNQQIAFTYMNVRHEVARLEIPSWVSKDKKVLNFALGAALSQAEKGGGYPVALAEAHNLAVIRANERARFFELLAQHLVGLGVERVRTSPKEFRKRRAII